MGMVTPSLHSLRTAPLSTSTAVSVWLSPALVHSALIGGLLAVPVAAAVLLIVDEVVFPKADLG